MFLYWPQNTRVRAQALQDAYPDLLDTRKAGGRFLTDLDLLNFSFHLALDGRGYPTLALYRPLLMRRLLFRQEGFAYAFFRAGLKPWRHYVPVAADLSDLVAKIEWARAHPVEARAIVRRGAAFARSHLLEGRMTALRYVGALIRAYAVRFPLVAGGSDSA